MSISEIARKMTAFSNGNLHDINHFMKVYAWAKVIGECEGLDEITLRILETAAIVHDIACPLCREKYGSCIPERQEQEGMPLAREFLADSGLDPAEVDRIVYLVGRHHTCEGVDGMDWQILLEADYIVNAGESSFSRENMENFVSRVFKTETGKSIMRDIYGVG